MNLPKLSKKFFALLDDRIGPFDRPFQFRVFPFDAGGALNFLTVGVGRGDSFITYVSWDLFGHEQQKRGGLGRYELLVVDDDQKWCVDVLTKIGRQSLQEVFEPGDTLDIGSWVEPEAPIQGVVFEDALRQELSGEPCGVLRCIGITRPELEFAKSHGPGMLAERLQQAGVYPHTVVQRNRSVI